MAHRPQKIQLSIATTGTVSPVRHIRQWLKDNVPQIEKAVVAIVAAIVALVAAISAHEKTGTKLLCGLPILLACTISFATWLVLFG